MFATCILGGFVSEMGFLLSFLYMTGWVTEYSEQGSAKEISQAVGTLSLIVGNGVGLLIGIIAEQTVVAPFFYLSFVLKAIPLLVLSLLGQYLSKGGILVCFVML